MFIIVVFMITKKWQQKWLPIDARMDKKDEYIHS